MLHLPDVSEDQPNVDWAEVAKRNGGAAVIRALYGTSHIDHAWGNGARRADAHAKGIRALGIYHYLRQDQEPLPQAEAYVRLVGSLRPGEFAALDLEEGEGDQAARAHAWLAHVDQKLTYPGYRGAWLYSFESFFKEHGLMPIAEAGMRHIWVADWGKDEPTDVPHSLWQHTTDEAWPGIGKCDCSIFDGDLAGLLDKIHSPKEEVAPHPESRG
jgi:GH25 family lysozyme M1 (1,4-beta-N-acetylmuramidase)